MPLSDFIIWLSELLPAPTLDLRVLWWGSSFFICFFSWHKKYFSFLAQKNTKPAQKNTKAAQIINKLVFYFSFTCFRNPNSAAIYCDTAKGLLRKIRCAKQTMPFGAAIAYVPILVNESINVLIPTHFASGVEFANSGLANLPVCPFRGRKGLPAFKTTVMIPAFIRPYYYFVWLCLPHTSTKATHLMNLLFCATLFFFTS